jgi:hypothetical protein
MNFEVHYKTRWIRDIRRCGIFPTLVLAIEHVNYLQNKLPNGNKITFKITG